MPQSLLSILCLAHLSLAVIIMVGELLLFGQVMLKGKVGMGIIDHVSRFNKAYGYREGWVFSSRFSHALSRLSEFTKGFRDRNDALQEKKDRDLFRYV